MIICPNCRAKLGDGSTACVVCGTPLTGASTAPNTTAPAPTAQIAPAPAAVQIVAPAPAAVSTTVQLDLAARPLQEQPLPREELIDEHKPASATSQPPQAQQPQQAGAPPAQSGQPLPPQAPPPDHPMYQQQGYQQQYPAQYQQQPVGNWNTHPYMPGQPNQCPRCHYQNIITFYNDGTAYCGACTYRYYWKAPNSPVDEVGREFSKLFG